LQVEDELAAAHNQRKELEQYLACLSAQQQATKKGAASEQSALKLMTRRVTEVETRHHRLLGKGVHATARMEGNWHGGGSVYT
jgi:hypothetical protein